MRQKADKLEKGKWYADTETSKMTTPTFFKFSHTYSKRDIFKVVLGEGYFLKHDGSCSFSQNANWYIPTQEDIEKYNLNETEL